MRCLVLVALVFGSSTLSMASIAAPNGHAVYVKYCSACHDPGSEHPGTARLADRWPHQASLLDREHLNAEYVRYIVRHGLNLMPPFRPSEISNDELEALGNYLALPPPQKKEPD